MVTRLIIILSLSLFSCSHIQSVRTNGSQRTTVKARKHMDFLGVKLVGSQVTVDTVTGKTIEKVKFNNRVTWNREVRGRVTTTYFDSSGQVTKILTVKDGKQISEERPAR